MPLQLTLSDSEVASVRIEAGDLRIRFSAAATVQTGTAPGEKPTAGFSRGLELRLRGVHIVESHEPLLGRVAEGHLRLGTDAPRRLPVPLDHAGPVHLELAFSNRASLVATGTGISVAFPGDAHFMESLAC